MTRVRLTDKFLQAVNPPIVGRSEFFDTVTTGLLLRVTSRGSRTWSVKYRIAGAQIRNTIGTYPAVGLAKARQIACDKLKLVGEGVDPRAASAAAEAVEAARVADTVVVIGRRFIDKYAAMKRWGELKRIMKGDVIPYWNDRLMESITRRDVRELIEGVAERASIQANRTLTVLRIFFRWAAKHDIIDGDPTAGVDKTEEMPRTRKFSDDEVRAFWVGCDRLGWPFGDCLKLLLLTGARKSEIAAAHWREISVADKVMQIPAARVKNNAAHAIPLSPAAIAIIAGLKRIGERPVLVFTTNGKTPVSGFSKAKSELDGYMVEELRRSSDAPDDVALEPWRIHDLRRVVRSNLGKLRVLSDVAERVLGHAIGGIRKVYDAHEYLDEKRDALDRWALRVQGIVSPDPKRVVRLGARR